MTEITMYDAATPWTPDRVQLAVAAKAAAVSIYIVGTPGNMRHASPDDVKAIRAANRGVLPNWERVADFFGTCSMSDAKNAGVEALAANRALGIPDDGSVATAFSFDFEVPPNRFQEMRDKLLYAHEGLGGHYQGIGYGQSSLCTYWAQQGLPGPHWLMMSTWGLPWHPEQPSVGIAQAHHQVNGSWWPLVDGQLDYVHPYWMASQIPEADPNIITQPNAIKIWWPADSPYAKPDNQKEYSNMFMVHAKSGSMSLLVAGTSIYLLQNDARDFYAAGGVTDTAIDDALYLPKRAVAQPYALNDIDNTIAALKSDVDATLAALKSDVDAQMAAVLDALSKLQPGTTTGSAPTAFSGTGTLTVDLTAKT